MAHNPQNLKIWQNVSRFFQTENSSYLILLLIFLFHLINNFIVIWLDNTPLYWDSNNYYINARRLFYNTDYYDFYPPFIPFLMIPLFALFGFSQKIAMLGVGSFSLFTLLVTTYLLAKDLHSKEAGLLSAFILSCCPVIFGHARTPMSDLMLSGWVVFSLLLMVQSKGFISLKYVIPMAIVIGLGMLTRVAFPLYVAGPSIYLLLKEKFSRRIFLNLLMIIVIILLLCSFWYFPHFYDTVREYSEIHHAFSFYKMTSLGGFLKDFFAYFFDLLGEGMGLIILPLFFLIGYKKNKRGFGSLPLLSAWIAVPYFALSLFFTAKIMRFVMPLLPVMAIVYSFLVLNIEKTVIRRIAIVIIVLLGIAQTLVISYSPFSRIIYPLSSSFNEWYALQFGQFKCWRLDWKFAEIAGVIRNTYPDIKKKVIFLEVRPVVSSGIEKLFYQEDADGSVSFCDRYSCDEDNVLLNTKKADIVILGESVNPADTEACKLFMSDIDKFALIKTIPSADGTMLRIYKRSVPFFKNRMH